MYQKWFISPTLKYPPTQINSNNMTTITLITSTWHLPSSNPCRHFHLIPDSSLMISPLSIISGRSDVGYHASILQFSLILSFHPQPMSRPSSLPMTSQRMRDYHGPVTTRFHIIISQPFVAWHLTQWNGYSIFSKSILSSSTHTAIPLKDKLQVIFFLYMPILAHIIFLTDLRLFLIFSDTSHNNLISKWIKYCLKIRITQINHSNNL